MAIDIIARGMATAASKPITVGDYAALDNKPKINGVLLLGNKTAEQLNLQAKLVEGDAIIIDDNTISVGVDNQTVRIVGSKLYVPIDDETIEIVNNKLQVRTASSDKYNSQDEKIGNGKLGVVIPDGKTIDIDENGRIYQSNIVQYDSGKVTFENTDKNHVPSADAVVRLFNKLASLNIEISTSDENTPLDVEWVDEYGNEHKGTLVADEKTIGLIYLVPIREGVYAQWITRLFTSAGISMYEWCFLGDTAVDLSNVITKDNNIAGVKFEEDGNISDVELLNALDIKDFAHAEQGETTIETIDELSIDPHTPTGEVELEWSNPSAEITKDVDYTPRGEVTVEEINGTTEDTNITYNGIGESFTYEEVDDHGTEYEITEGSVIQDSSLDDDFVVEGITFTVEDKCVKFANATSKKAITNVGAVTYTAPVLSGSLPTYKEVTQENLIKTTNIPQFVVNGANYTIQPIAEFTGTTDENLLISDIKYFKTDTATFIGDEQEFNIDVVASEKTLDVNPKE